MGVLVFSEMLRLFGSDYAGVIPAITAHTVTLMVVK